MEQTVDSQPPRIAADVDNLMNELEKLRRKLVGIRESQTGASQTAKSTTPHPSELVMMGK